MKIHGLWKALIPAVLVFVALLVFDPFGGDEDAGPSYPAYDAQQVVPLFDEVAVTGLDTPAAQVWMNFGEERPPIVSVGAFDEAWTWHNAYMAQGAWSPAALEEIGVNVLYNQPTWDNTTEPLARIQVLAFGKESGTLLANTPIEGLQERIPRGYNSAYDLPSDETIWYFGYGDAPNGTEPLPDDLGDLRPQVTAGAQVTPEGGIFVDEIYHPWLGPIRLVVKVLEYPTL